MLQNRLFHFLITALLATFTLSAGAEKTDYFRIGTGGASGTYYPIGGVIAQAISNPPGSRPCEKGGSCGVPGLVAIAISSNGSVANIEAILSGEMESGFAQSDIVYWAFTGTDTYQGKDKADKLRAIASLYPETIHLVASKDSGIKTVADLRGKRVSLDESGSGTLVDARLILQAYGLSEAEIEADYTKASQAVEKMKAGELDAFFVVAGYPTGAIVDLTDAEDAVLIPINGPEARQLLKQFNYFAPAKIPANTYKGIEETETIGVNALWVTNADADEKLIYDITKALWNERSHTLLNNGHTQGKAVTVDSSLDSIGIPLHPGAKKYYGGIGKRY